MDNLELERQNTVRSRNLRLTAYERFSDLLADETLPRYTVERALNVPMKRFDQPLIGHFRPEIIAILGAPGDGWTSQRDHLLFTIIYNTGLGVRVINIRVVDVVLDGSACVHLNGKGRRKRSIPLWKSTVGIIRAWLQPIRTCTVMRHCFLPDRATNDAS